jgi:hypothetical protein
MLNKSIKKDQETHMNIVDDEEKYSKSAAVSNVKSSFRKVIRSEKMHVRKIEEPTSKYLEIK